MHKAKEDHVLKNLKKVISLMLVIVMMASVAVMFNSCSDSDSSGPVIDIYAPYTVNLDPATAYADEASSKLLSLLYEGLTYIDSKGRVKGALADEWVTYTDRDGNKILEITLKNTRWSDKLTVDAEDFIDSWERILDPAFNCEAASLLFPIKNAVSVKCGDMTLSDLGLTASKRDTLTITLEDWADPDVFLRNCASVALYPIRKDVINKIYDKENGKENDWSTLIAIMVSNGPFFLKRVSFGDSTDGVSTRPYMTLERNQNYYRDIDKEQALDKYVIPYQINVNMTYGNDDVAEFVDSKYPQVIADYKRQTGVAMVTAYSDAIKSTMTEEEIQSYGSELNKKLEEMATAQIKAEIKETYSVEYAAKALETIRANKDVYYNYYNEGTVLYNEALPLTADVSGVTKTPNMMTGSFYFNVNNALFGNAKVRQALSLALDRKEIASLVKYASAADTLVTNGVFETTRKTSFKDNSSDYALSKTADKTKAMSLLAEAGVQGGKFSISVRATELDIMIAQYAAEKWNELGFEVGIRVYGYNLTTYSEKMLVVTDQKDENGKAIKAWQDVVIYDGLLHDSFIDAYQSSDFDVIFYDVNMLSTDAFAVLAPFAAIYSGRAYDFSDAANFDTLMYHATGYYNETYDALMQQALVETDASKRAEYLHQAEALLLSDMPITPVIYYESGSLLSGELDDVERSYYGAPIFTETTYDNYVPSTEVEETQAQTPSTSPVTE